MPRLLRMPEVAANMAEAVLQEWAVPENSPFTATDAIATVETEKAVVDIEAETDGVILRTLVPGGTQVEVGAPIALLGDPGEKVSDVEAALADLGVSSTTRKVPDPEGGTANTETTAVQTEAGAANTSGPPVDGAEGPNGHRVFASPLARRLAREAGLRLDTIRGTGPRGRVLRRDVEAATAVPATEAPATAPPVPAEPAIQGSAHYSDVPHTRMRRAIADRLSHSKQTIPHFYLRAAARADPLLRLRAELNDGSTPKVSLNDLVVKAVARAHALVPEMNVTWGPDAVRQYAGVDVAVAVATERGLVTPVVRGVDSLSLTAVAASVRDLVERAKSGRLRQEELEGGSISVTNLGMFDVEEFAAIINPPQAAILAVGAVRAEPVVVDGDVVAGSVMRVTLSVDHRPVDGVVAARWLQTFVRLVESPVRILA